MSLKDCHGLAGRLHICCVAQPVSFEVPIEVHNELSNLPPSPGPALGDRRHDEVAQALERAALAAHESSRLAALPSRPPAATCRASRPARSNTVTTTSSTAPRRSSPTESIPIW